MEKAIAIIDKPENCEKCVFGICKYLLPLSTHRKAYYCQLKEPKGRVAEDFDYDADVHLSNCPLKPIPSKKEEWIKTSGTSKGVHGAKRNGFNTGYNACVDEILGGSE